MIHLMVKYALFLAVLALPSSASAQLVFIQGSVVADIKRFDDEAGQSAYDGTARALAFGIGHNITSHWFFSAEVDLGARSTRTTTTDVVVISGASRVIHNSYSSQRRSIAALAGYRTAPQRRVQLGYYGGVCFTTLRREIASDAAAVVLQDAAALGLDTFPVTSRYEDRLTGPIVGFDAAFRTGPHVAIVAALKAQGLKVGEELGGHSIRPAIGARIAF
jgi:hypothetical protein